MNAAALKAYVDAHVDAGPLRHFAAAFKAHEICSILHSFFENGFGLWASSGRRNVPTAHGRRGLLTDEMQ